MLRSYVPSLFRVEILLDQGAGTQYMAASAIFFAAYAYVLPCTQRVPATALAVSMGWSTPTWNWGYANGDAHDEAMRIRTALAEPHARAKFLQTTAAGESGIEDVKMALALSCQRARNVGYDTRERSWETLMGTRYLHAHLLLMKDCCAYS